jgi:hypothetical protein
MEQSEPAVVEPEVQFSQGTTEKLQARNNATEVASDNLISWPKDAKRTGEGQPEPQEYVKGYVEFVHYVERLYEAAKNPAKGHYPGAAGAAAH